MGTIALAFLTNIARRLRSNIQGLGQAAASSVRFRQQHQTVNLVKVAALGHLAAGARRQLAHGAARPRVCTAPTARGQNLPPIPHDPRSKLG